VKLPAPLRVQATELLPDQLAIKSPELLQQLRADPGATLERLTAGVVTLSLNDIHIDAGGRVVIMNAALARHIAQAGDRLQGVLLSNHLCDSLANGSCGSTNLGCSGFTNQSCFVTNNACS
jgi:hypothetical protein